MLVLLDLSYRASEILKILGFCLEDINLIASILGTKCLKKASISSK